MTTFFTLLLAHLIADFPLQTNRIFAMKLRSNKGIALHVLIHLIVTALLIRDPLSHFPLFLLLGSSHFFFDWLKLRNPIKLQVPGFLIDQVLHVVTLSFLTAIFANVETRLTSVWLYVALFYAFLPPLIMFAWLLAIDIGRIKLRPSRSIFWAQRNLLPISQCFGLPLLFGVGFLIF